MRINATKTRLKKMHRSGICNSSMILKETQRSAVHTVVTNFMALS